MQKYTDMVRMASNLEGISVTAQLRGMQGTGKDIIQLWFYPAHRPAARDGLPQ